MSTPEERADEILADLRTVARPRLIVISGPSGAGKDTIIDRMRELHPEIYFAVTATTRPRRPGEIDGVHYHFYSREEFAQKLVAGEFIESAEVYGHFYGVPRSFIRHALAQDKDVVVKVDTQGAETFRHLAPTALLIFIAPPTMDDLARRLRLRNTEDPEAFLRRLHTARREVATFELFDYVVFNESDRQDQTVTEIMAILLAQKRRIHQPEVDL